MNDWVQCVVKSAGYVHGHVCSKTNVSSYSPRSCKPREAIGPRVWAVASKRQDDVVNALEVIRGRLPSCPLRSGCWHANFVQCCQRRPRHLHSLAHAALDELLAALMKLIGNVRVGVCGLNPAFIHLT
jgi:hypothetical protein